jgi:hypothetical protein
MKRDEAATPTVARDPQWPAQLMALRHTATEVAQKAKHIYNTVLDRSSAIRAGNFTSIGESDLELLFDLYDLEFFEGLLKRMLRSAQVGKIGLRLSSRMTRAAAKTYLRRSRQRTASGVVEHVSYEIAVSSFLLFQTFREPGRTAIVTGLECRDRLEALQRVFEHELLHLAEFLASGRSSCASESFQALSRSIFGHAGVHHDLVTRPQLAAETFGIRTGDRVRFEHEGVTRTGLVNRITKRATVLVEDPRGRPFSDGHRYALFYVPLTMLRPAREMSG